MAHGNNNNFAHMRFMPEEELKRYHRPGRYSDKSHVLAYPNTGNNSHRVEWHEALRRAEFAHFS